MPKVVDAKGDLVAFGGRPRLHTHDAGVQNGNVEPVLGRTELCHGRFDRLKGREVDVQVADGRMLVGDGVTDGADDRCAGVVAREVSNVDARRLVARKFYGHLLSQVAGAACDEDDFAREAGYVAGRVEGDAVLVP